MTCEHDGNCSNPFANGNTKHSQKIVLYIVRGNKTHPICSWCWSEISNSQIEW